MSEYRCKRCQKDVNKNDIYCRYCGNVFNQIEFNKLMQYQREMQQKKEQENERKQAVNEILQPKFKPYVKKELLSRNELSVYKRLYKIAFDNRLCVLSKVRMSDLVIPNPECNKDENFRLFGKIKYKHIDFILAKPENLEPVILIEVDDKSHDWASRKERDIFIDEAYSNAGYRIIHILSNSNIEKIIYDILQAK